MYLKILALLGMGAGKDISFHDVEIRAGISVLKFSLRSGLHLRDFCAKINIELCDFDIKNEK